MIVLYRAVVKNQKTQVRDGNLARPDAHPPVAHGVRLTPRSSSNSHVWCLVTLGRTMFLSSCERFMSRPPLETPIERIFRKVMRQKMPLAVREILLRKPSAPRLKLRPSRP